MNTKLLGNLFKWIAHLAIPVAATVYSDKIVQWLSSMLEKQIDWQIWQTATLSGASAIFLALVASGWWQDTIAWRYLWAKDKFYLPTTFGGFMDNVSVFIVMYIYRWAAVQLVIWILIVVNQVWPAVRDVYALTQLWATQVVIQMSIIWPLLAWFVGQKRIQPYWKVTKKLVIGTFIVAFVIEVVIVIAFLVIPTQMTHTVEKILDYMDNVVPTEPPATEAPIIQLPNTSASTDFCAQTVSGRLRALDNEDVFVLSVKEDEAGRTCPEQDMPEAVQFSSVQEPTVLKDMEIICKENPWLLDFALSKTFTVNCEWYGEYLRPDGPMPEVFIEGCEYVYTTDKEESNFLSYSGEGDYFTSFHYQGETLEYAGENAVRIDGVLHYVYKAHPRTMQGCNQMVDSPDDIEWLCSYQVPWADEVLDVLRAYTIHSAATGVDYPCGYSYGTHLKVDSHREIQALNEIGTLCDVDEGYLTIKQVRASVDLTVDCDKVSAINPVTTLTPQVYSGCEYEWNGYSPYGFFVYVDVGGGEITTFFYPNGTRAVYDGGKLGNLKFKLGELEGRVYNAKLYGSPANCTVP